MSTTLVIGSLGQDGTLLSDALTRDGHTVFGLTRQTVQGPYSTAFPTPITLSDLASLSHLLVCTQPDQIYYLAAHHGSAELTDANTYATLTQCLATHVLGLTNVLEAMRLHTPAARLFYAASSHIFGDPVTTPQDESTPLLPFCPYGITKAAGMQICELYRKNHGLFVAAGILYNHESPLRGPQFVSSRIVKGAVAVARGRANQLTLSKLDAVVDWGWANDTIAAMRAILLLPEAGDYVIGTGKPHTVQEFAEIAFAELGLQASQYLVQSDGITRTDPRRNILLANPAKLMRDTGWKPKVEFADMVKLLVRAELAKEDA